MPHSAEYAIRRQDTARPLLFLHPALMVEMSEYIRCVGGLNDLERKNRTHNVIYS